MQHTPLKYPQQDGTTLQGAIINYTDMMLPGEKQDTWELLLPLYGKPLHLSEVTMLHIHAVQQSMWINKASSEAIDRFNAHWNMIASIALADHNIKLYVIAPRRELF